MDFAQPWRCVGENDLSVILERDFQITAAVFQGIVQDIAEYPAEGIPVKLLFDPLFAYMDQGLDFPAGKGGISIL